jgi:hypothetical protein
MKNKLMFPVVMGGLGGALNALFCLIKFPAAIPGAEDVLHWHILLAGFIHGSILTVVALRAAQCLLSKNSAARLAGVLGAGYAAGWISYIPLRISINSNQTFKEILSAFWWPFSNGFNFDILWSPFMTFGAVSALYSFLLIRLAVRGGPQTAFAHFGAAAISGVLGSLWWWNGFERPYFCLLHGVIWGVFVGLGVWKFEAYPAK